MKPILWMLLLFMAVASAQTVTTLVHFPNLANTPTGLMTQGADGTFYGNTWGATPDTYTVFKLTLSGGLSTLFDFVKVADAPPPLGGPVLTADGSLYDGFQEFGTNNTQIYKISANGSGAVFHQFATDLSEGLYVNSRLILGSDGNVYGTTGEGGTPGATGTIFQLTPSFKILYQFFYPNTVGAIPNGLIVGSDGNFYGTTSAGGVVTDGAPNGGGVVFRLTLSGALIVLHAFSASDGWSPDGTLAQGPDGSLYGTTSVGPGNNHGTIFRVTPSGAFTLLYTFPFYTGGTAGVVLAPDGNFYGTTEEGGANNLGSIFRLSPDGTVTTVHSFAKAVDGFSPVGLILGQDGNLYGLTSGTAYRFAPASATPSSPVISAVVNGASFQPGVSPGSWITISGSNLSAVTDTWANEIVNGILPTMLDGVSVFVGGQPAYVYYISSTQINALAPNIGPGTVSVTVMNSIGTSAPFSVVSQTFQPAFFQWGTYAVATRTDYSLAVKNGTFSVTTAPAKPGDVIILWGTGFGPTSPAAPVGAEVPTTSTYNTSNPVSVMVGTAPAMVYGAALASGYAGLYQVAIQIPSLANGDYPVVATVSGAQSPSTTLITVQQ